MTTKLPAPEVELRTEFSEEASAIGAPSRRTLIPPVKFRKEPLLMLRRMTLGPVTFTAETVTRIPLWTLPTERLNCGATLVAFSPELSTETVAAIVLSWAALEISLSFSVLALYNVALVSLSWSPGEPVPKKIGMKATRSSSPLPVIERTPLAGAEVKFARGATE